MVVALVERAAVRGCMGSWHGMEEVHEVIEVPEEEEHDHGAEEVHGAPAGPGGGAWVSVAVWWWWWWMVWHG